MAYAPQLTANYVKFVRGSQTAWESIQYTADRDTLYFIVEKDAEEGKLYLGNVLISNGAKLESIRDILDVNVPDKIDDGSILIYDAEDQQWDVTNLNEYLINYIGDMVGATATRNGEAGLVPAPKKEDRNRFLKGDGTWADVAVDDARVEALEEAVNGIPASASETAVPGLIERVTKLENTSRWYLLEVTDDTLRISEDRG